MIRLATLSIFAVSILSLTGCAQLADWKTRLEQAQELNRRLQSQVDELRHRYESAVADAEIARDALTAEQRALARIYSE